MGVCTHLFPGKILYNLTPITIWRGGEGSSVTVVNTTTVGGSLTQVRDYQWRVSFHEGLTNTTPPTPAVAVGPVYVQRD